MNSRQTLRQRQGLATAPDIERSGRRRAHVSEWKATPPTPLAALPTPKPTRWDRFATAAWRLHDGMPVVWALLGAIVLMASVAATVLIAASARGWSP